jgi:hypothetical protein
LKTFIHPFLEASLHLLGPWLNWWRWHSIAIDFRVDTFSIALDAITITQVQVIVLWQAKGKVRMSLEAATINACG